MFDGFKKQTELKILRNEFKFLEIDYGYDLLRQETRDFYRGKNLVVYRSKLAQKQIEICGTNNFFFCIIRRIQNEELSSYSDRINNVEIDDLAMVENPEYDRSDFHSCEENNLIKVANKTCELFKRQKQFMISDEWIDIGKIESLKNGKLSHRFRAVKDNSPDLFISKLKNMIDSEFPKFQILFYNLDLPNYHKDSLLEKLIYQLEGKKLKIKQRDWRDYRQNYTVFINDKKIEEIEVEEFKNQDDAIDEIKNACNNAW